MINSLGVRRAGRILFDGDSRAGPESWAETHEPATQVDLEFRSRAPAKQAGREYERQGDSEHVHVR